MDKATAKSVANAFLSNAIQKSRLEIVTDCINHYNSPDKGPLSLAQIMDLSYRDPPTYQNLLMAAFCTANQFRVSLRKSPFLPTMDPTKFYVYNCDTVTTFASKKEAHDFCIPSNAAYLPFCFFVFNKDQSYEAFVPQESLLE